MSQQRITIATAKIHPFCVEGPGLNKSDVLEAVSFGQRIAEQEIEELSSYFIAVSR